MKKNLLRLLIAAVALCVGAVIGKFVGGIIGDRLREESLPEEKYVYFAKSEEDLSDAEAVESTGLAEYESEFRELNTYTYFRALKEEERLVYRMLERALDEGAGYILADERLFYGCERSVMEITTFFSLDSPMVEQNLSVSVLKSVTEPDRKGSFYRIEIERFGERFLVKKKEALEKARELAQAAPADGSDTETALHFYQYLTDHVSYHDYGGEERAEAHFLHDALFAGYAHCDGFSNAFSLLCALRGIPALEKQYNPAAGSLDVGHAWSTVLLDGDWYNVDCALNEDTARAEEEYGILFRFGFSDELQSDPCDYGSLLPKCEKNYVPVSFRLPSANDPAFYGAVLEAFEETELHYIVFSLETDDLQREHLQEVVARRHCAMRVITANWNGRVYYFMIQE